MHEPLTGAAQQGLDTPPPASADAEKGPSDAASDPLTELLVPLAGIDRRPLAEHPAAYEQLHQRLQEILADPDGP